MYAAVSNRKRKMEAQAIFLNQFSVSSSNKWKFVVCPKVNEEMKGSYSFANRLNGFAHLSQVDGLNMYSRKSKQPSLCQTSRTVILIVLQSGVTQMNLQQGKKWLCNIKGTVRILLKLGTGKVINRV
jgi:hypothetical protein